MGFVDLHVHSVRSDGTFTPAELVDYAVEKGLAAMALTDHDTVDGIDEILEYAKGKPIEVIPGIEYSTEYMGRDVHIVGLFIDHKAPEFLGYLDRFKKSRTVRNYKLCANLRGAGIDISYEELMGEFPGAVITRAHYAKLLLKKGYVNSSREAFDRYLGDHTPYFVHREKITPKEVIDVTLAAGGLPILAHPLLYGLGKEQLEELVKLLKSQGLMGMETVYSTFLPADERRMKRLAKKYGLLESGGSDFHGANKPGLDLATGYGKLYVDEEVLEKQKRALRTKIFFTDMDNTLLTADKKISDRTYDKLMEMLAGGHHLAFASGRPVNSILDTVKALGIIDGYRRLSGKGRIGGIYATAYNGALVYDCIEGRAVEQLVISMETAQRIFDMAVSENVHIQTYTDTHIVASCDDEELEFYTKTVIMPYVVETDLGRALEKPPYKLIAIALDDRQKLERLREIIEGSDIGDEVMCAYSNAKYLEFYNKNAGKGNALVALCRALNVPVRNSVAAGDEENDISMIKAAGVGAAVANANPALKECADYVTENDNEHDAAVEIIDKFILS